MRLQKPLDALLEVYAIIIAIFGYVDREENQHAGRKANVGDSA